MSGVDAGEGTNIAYGDPRWTAVGGGSTATSAAGAHNIYAGNGGLSTLNANEVVAIMLSASGGDFRLSLHPARGATNDSSLRIYSAASLFDVPPMAVSDASQITFAREGTNNPVAYWTIMRRIP